MCVNVWTHLWRRRSSRREIGADLMFPVLPHLPLSLTTTQYFAICHHLMPALDYLRTQHFACTPDVSALDMHANQTCVDGD
jgi:hypothetical protein